MSSGRPDPIVLAFILCDYAYQDPISNRLSLLGIMNRFYVPSFPWKGEGPTAYVAMTNGHGVTSLRVELTRADGVEERFVARMSGPLKFDDPQAVEEMAISFSGAPFNAPGMYRMHLYASGPVPIASRKFLVEAREDSRR